MLCIKCFILITFLSIGYGSLDKATVKWKVIKYANAPRPSNYKIGPADYYIPKNNVPTGIAPYKNKLFVTVPRLDHGVPSSLNYVDLRDVRKNRSPPLRAYPNYEINELRQDQRNKLLPDPKRIISVHRVRIDDCNRLWLVDTGVIKSTVKRSTRTTRQAPGVGGSSSVSAEKTVGDGGGENGAGETNGGSSEGIGVSVADGLGTVGGDSGNRESGGGNTEGGISDGGNSVGEGGSEAEVHGGDGGAEEDGGGLGGEREDEGGSEGNGGEGSKGGSGEGAGSLGGVIGGGSVGPENVEGGSDGKHGDGGEGGISEGGTGGGGSGSENGAEGGGGEAAEGENDGGGTSKGGNGEGGSAGGDGDVASSSGGGLSGDGNNGEDGTIEEDTAHGGNVEESSSGGGGGGGNAEGGSGGGGASESGDNEGGGSGGGGASGSGDKEGGGSNEAGSDGEVTLGESEENGGGGGGGVSIGVGNNGGEIGGAGNGNGGSEGTVGGGNGGEGSNEGGSSDAGNGDGGTVGGGTNGGGIDGGGTEGGGTNGEGSVGGEIGNGGIDGGEADGEGENGNGDEHGEGQGTIGSEGVGGNGGEGNSGGSCTTTTGGEQDDCLPDNGCAVENNGEQSSSDHPTREIKIIRIQPPSIWVFDLRTDRLIRRFEIPDEFAQNPDGFVNINVDVNRTQCEKAYAYIPNSKTPSILVYSFQRNHIWLQSDQTFKNDRITSNLRVHPADLTHINSIALGKRNRQTRERIAYYHPLASFNQFGVYTSVLQNEHRRTQSHKPDFKFIGNTASEVLVHEIDQRTGVMFYALIRRNALACWDTKKSLVPRNIAIFAEDRALMKYPSDLKIDSRGNLWYLTNRQYDTVCGRLKPHIYNFHVFSHRIRNIIDDTVCEPNYNENGGDDGGAYRVDSPNQQEHTNSDKCDDLKGLPCIMDEDDLSTREYTAGEKHDEIFAILNEHSNQTLSN